MDDDLDWDDADDTPDLDFDGDFDMMTGYITYVSRNMMMIKKAKALNSGSNVKINDPVKMYSKKLGELELLNHDHEIELAKRIFRDEQAKRTSVGGKLKISCFIAKRYVGRNVILDLIKKETWG